MIAFLVKVLSSAVVIGLVTEVARRSPSLGGVLSALAVVSLISFAWLVKQGSERTELSTFLKSVLLGLLATFLLLAVLYGLIRLGIPVFYSILVLRRVFLSSAGMSNDIYNSGGRRNGKGEKAMVIIQTERLTVRPCTTKDVTRLQQQHYDNGSKFSIT
ncbi:hypothetical protein OVA29_09875 [Exiguobacterium sp. SL14]|nr:hypothetical protein [Exiguobacterium sp. SL14]MCY1690933.1 hypothetical protein [Exiguobacterium sp. SL14]